MNRSTLASIPKSAQPLALAKLSATHGTVLHVASHDQAMQQLTATLPFFAPQMQLLTFPAWDVFPFDQTSPKPAIVTQRLHCLTQLLSPTDGQPRIVLTTIAALLQKLLPKSALIDNHFYIKAGQPLAREKLARWLGEQGYRHSSKAMEAGEYAFRGSIVDIIEIGSENGMRIDLFGDEVESLKPFDPLTQATLPSSQEQRAMRLLPASEIVLSEENIARFRAGYRDAFGAIAHEDPLYEAVRGGSRYAGFEHLLPLFYDELATLLDYAAPDVITFDEHTDSLVQERHQLIAEYFSARKAANGALAHSSDMRYPLLAEKQLYVMEEEYKQLIAGQNCAEFSSVSSTFVE